jgi:hypothetical protein
MKKWLVLVGLSIVFLAACDLLTSREQPTSSGGNTSGQATQAELTPPTSFGGITPGQTTREELKGLVKNPNKVDTGGWIGGFELKQPDGISYVSARFHNDIIYEVSVSLNYFFSGPEKELKSALIEKYGRPGIKVGGIRTVTCRNKLGASFERLEGQEELRWPVKDGVQGAFESSAGECAEYVSRSYVLRHVATVKAVEIAEFERARKRAEDQKRKLGGAY